MRSFRNSRLQCAWIAVIVILLPSLACGQAVEGCDDGTFYVRLLKRYSEKCMRDNADLQARIEKATQGVYGPDAARLDWVQAVRAELQAQLNTLPAANEPGSEEYIEALRKKLIKAVADLAAARSPDEAAALDSLRLDNFEHLNDPNDSPPRLIVDRGCMDSTDDASICKAVFDQAAEIADSIFVARYTVDTVQRREREQFRAHVGELGARWHAYLYDAGFQYWWELAGNRYLEEHCEHVFNLPMTKVLRKKCEYRRDRAGNPIGWRAVPEYHIVYFHPDVGAQYNTEEPKGDRLKPSLVFQWLGYQWWSWQGSKVSNLRGVSFVTSVSDNKVARTFGHGMQIQINQFAVAFTNHGGKPAITLSLNLADKFAKLDQAWSERLKRLANGEE